MLVCDEVEPRRIIDSDAVKMLPAYDRNALRNERRNPDRGAERTHGALFHQILDSDSRPLSIRAPFVGIAHSPSPSNSSAV